MNLSIRRRHLWFLLAYVLLLSLLLLAGQRSRDLDPPYLPYNAYIPAGATPKSAWEDGPSLEAYLRSQGIPLPEQSQVEFGISEWSEDPVTRITFQELGRSRTVFEAWLTRTCGRDLWIRRWASYHLGSSKVYLREQSLMGTPTDPYRGHFTIVRFRPGPDEPLLLRMGSAELYSTVLYYPGRAWPLLACLCILPVALVYVLRRPLARLIPERVRRALKR